MFNLSGSELIVIMLLALVVLGPEKLPEALRRFGRTYAEIKKLGSGFQQEFKAAMEEPTRELRETANLLKSSVDGVTAPAAAVVRDAAGVEKPVSPGGPADVHPPDPAAPDPLLSDLPFEPGQETAAPLASNGATPDGDHADVDAAPARPNGPAFHSAAPPRVETPVASGDAAGDGEAPST